MIVTRWLAFHDSRYGGLFRPDQGLLLMMARYIDTLLFQFPLLARTLGFDEAL